MVKKMAPAKKTDLLVKSIQKRNGAIVSFDLERIVNAINKAMLQTGEGSPAEAAMVANKVYADVVRIARKYKNFVPTVEGIQDSVEKELILSEYVQTAKAYIIYREERAKLRSQGIAVPEHVKKLAEDSKKNFRTALGEFIYYRSYSKWIEEEGRRETWIETVERYIAFMKENLGKKLSEREYGEVREAILKQEAMPSMRLLQFAGKAARATNVCAYNCSYIAPENFEDMAEIMYISMCGTGAGWSAESQNVQKFPQIKIQSGKKHEAHVIEDSKEGWCNAFILGMKTWADGEDVDFDYSLLRPAGARLKTMGGKSSGPDPLRRLLNFTREKMLRRQGKRLTNLDVHDIICMIGDCVVSGGVRRSAMISLSDLDDNDIRDAKKGQFYLTEPQRTLANNSAVYVQKPTNEEFLEEWMALIKSRSGERGIFNRGSLAKTLPARRIEVLKGYKGYFDATGNIIGPIGTNPCVTDDTWVMTTEGARRVKDLIGINFNALVDSKSYPSGGFFKTGEKNVFEIKTSRGFSFKATDNHKVLVVDYKTRKVQKNIWKEVKDLKMGDSIVLNNHAETQWSGRGTRSEGWLLGSLLGDGNIEKNQKANLDFWGFNRDTMMQYAVALVHESVGARSDMVGHKAQTGYARVQSVRLGKLASGYEMTNESKVPGDTIEQASSEFYEGFLQGWFDADGSVQGNQGKGVSVRLSSNSLISLQVAQRMLARIGIISCIYKNRRNGSNRLLPNGKGGYSLYHCESNHELVISASNIVRFAKRVSFIEKEKKDKLDFALSHYKRVLNKESFVSTIESIDPIGIQSVYDCTVEEAHAFDGNGIMLHNCGEIILQSKQFCNLSEIVARSNDTEASLMRKMKVATILGTYQSTLTNFPYLSKEWKEHCEKERLLGVSITGQWDSPEVRKPAVLKKLKNEAIRLNKIYAKKFGVNQSTCITCVKPSGTLSQTVDCSSGMHPRHSEYYIRRVRISATDSLFKMLRDQGVPYHPEVGQSMEMATTYVLEFPVKSPKGSLYKDDITAINQLEHWKMVKENYTEHNPSVTVSVGDDEWIQVANWLYSNWDLVGGLSFLPRDNHVYQLAPYETITEKQYIEMAKRLEHIDFSKIMTYEIQDETEAKKELACAGGVCEIDDVPVKAKAVA